MAEARRRFKIFIGTFEPTLSAFCAPFRGDHVQIYLRFLGIRILEFLDYRVALIAWFYV